MPHFLSSSASNFSCPNYSYNCPEHCPDYAVNMGDCRLVCGPQAVSESNTKTLIVLFDVPQLDSSAEFLSGKVDGFHSGRQNADGGRVTENRSQHNMHVYSAGSTIPRSLFAASQRITSIAFSFVSFFSFAIILSVGLFFFNQLS